MYIQASSDFLQSQNIVLFKENYPEFE